MSFLSPLFLLGSLSAAIPILVHLVRRTRAVRVQFPSLMFVRKIDQLTIRKRRIQNLLLLALRCAALVFLSLAFSRPYFTAAASPSTSSGAAAIMVDVSCSMRYPGVFDRARGAALDVVTRTPSAIQLALAAFSDHVQVVKRPGSDRADLDAAIKDLTPGFAATDYATALQTASGLLGHAAENRTIYLISDFQRAGVDKQGVPAGLAPGVEVVPIDVGDPSPRNLAITAVRAAAAIYSQKYPGKIEAKVTESGVPSTDATPVDVGIELKLNGLVVARQQMKVANGTTASVDFEGFNVPEGLNRATITLTGDKFPFDNDYFFTITRSAQEQVLAIDAPSRGRSASFYLQQALLSGEQAPYSLSIKTPNSVDPATLDRYQVVIIDGASDISGELGASLRKFVQKGGGLIIAAGKDTSGTRFDTDLGALCPAGIGDSIVPSAGFATVSDINFDHPIFSAFKAKGRFVPIKVYGYRRLSPRENGVVLAALDDGSPYLVEGRFGSGRTLLFASALDNSWTDLPLTPVFLPLMNQILEYFKAAAQPSACEIGQLIPVSLDQDGSQPSVESPSRDSVPLNKSPAGQLTVLAGEPGFYAVKYHDRTEYVAVNCDPTESDFSKLDVNDYLSRFKRGGAPPQAEADLQHRTPEQIEARQRAWVPILVLSMLLFIAESWLSRRIRRPRMVG